MTTCSYGFREVIDAMLPGKASKLQAVLNRTLNRHRWSGREYQGVERTQVKELGKMATVTSGEGAPVPVMGLAPGAGAGRRYQMAATV